VDVLIVAKHYFQILDTLWVRFSTATKGLVDDGGFSLLDLQNSILDSFRNLGRN
jgi:hypothetical protein